ncbi:MAG: response regulator transcription factor [Candidatus Kapaibacterium sp.]|nr:response regulator transcription factor [Bacteroidota bacterium]
MNTATTKLNILIIDDEEQIQTVLGITLQQQGFGVHGEFDGASGLHAVANGSYDIIILDMNLPDMTGLDVLRAIRQHSNIPVVILSVMGEEQRKVELLEAGADDYLTKPFGTAELVARLKVAHRHAKVSNTINTFQSSGITLDIPNHTVHKNGELLALTGTEFTLLSLLIKNQGKIVTYKTILHQVWGEHFTNSTQYVHVHIAALRKKLEDDSATQKLIKTESGIGYRWMGE